MKREVWSAGTFRRLRIVIDATRGPTRYEHDALGNLAAAAYEDGHVDLRMPDAVGHLFRTRNRSDRKYGPAGQLLEARADDGAITTYDYDPEGNLARKLVRPAGGAPEQVWRYDWNGAGLLAKGTPPRRRRGDLHLRPLARRLSKTSHGRTTRWLWDGNVPLHEWVETAPGAIAAAPAPVDELQSYEIAARHRLAALNERPAQGPPEHDGAEPGTPTAPITWLFDPESFAPTGKLVGDAHYAIVTDHLGTPTAMYDAAGTEVWSATIDAFGDLRHLTGPRQACPFRWQVRGRGDGAVL